MCLDLTAANPGMVVQTFGMAFPTRSGTEAVLTSLADGTLTPSEANHWACPFVVEEATHPARMDRVVWNALTTLCGADLESAPGVLLHGSEDFAGLARTVQTRRASDTGMTKRYAADIPMAAGARDAADECDQARTIRSASTWSASQALSVESTNQTGASRPEARRAPTSAIHAGDRHSKMRADMNLGSGIWLSPGVHPSHSTGAISTG
jgi:hypothetical protein